MTFSRQTKCFNILFCNKKTFHIFRTDIWVAQGCCCWWQLSLCSGWMLQVWLSQKACWVRQHQFVLQLAEKLCCPWGAWSKAEGKLFQSWALSVGEMTSACIVLYLFWESLLNSLHGRLRLPTQRTSQALQFPCNPSHVNWGTLWVNYWEEGWELCCSSGSSLGADAECREWFLHWS